MTNDFSTVILIAFFTILTCIVISFLVNKYFLNNASSFGKNKGGSQIRWATATRPPVGGMSFYATFIILFAVIIILSLLDIITWS